jgi:hypothetical protein
MAGRLRIATTGIQDQWLTGEPQFSYFLMKFKRHTKFSFDYVESQFDGKIDFGSLLTCRVPNDKGDLIKNFTLKVTLPDPNPTTNVWSKSIITHMIDYAELVIGGQVIEKITGEYIYMQQQLNSTNDDIEQTLYFLNGHGNLLAYTGTYTYFLDLPFYFYRHPSLSIPTCALTKQIVEVRIKLRPLSELIHFGAPENIQASIRKFSMDTEYVYLMDDEKGFLMSRPIDYVITQLQIAKFKMKPDETKKSVMLNFAHPVKELFFVSQSQDSVQNNFPNQYNTITNAELRFNNEVVFNRENLFLTYEQGLKHHINVPQASTDSKFGMYSFSLRPDVHYPTGQVNMSRISHKRFTIDIVPKEPTVENDTRVYAINYNVLRFENGLAGLKF